MNIPILLRQIASNQATIEEHQALIDDTKRRQGEAIEKLGPILSDGLDRDNFPLRLQLYNGYELRVSDQIFKQYANYANFITVCRTENLDQATLMTLLEGIEE